MGGALSNPKRPFVAILGGAKVSDKIGVINNLIEKVDTLIVGGGMAYTFFKAQGHEIGTSICENDKLDLATEIMNKAHEKGVDFLLPVAATILFAPTIFIFYNASAWVYIIAYSVVALIGNGIGRAFNKRK